MRANEFKGKENMKKSKKKAKNKTINFNENEKNLDYEQSVKEEFSEKAFFEKNFTNQIKNQLIQNKHCLREIQPIFERSELKIIEKPFVNKKYKRKNPNIITEVIEKEENIPLNDYIFVDNYDLIEDFEII